MTSEEKTRARELRRQGLSYNEIREQVNVSKGTLSLWVRDITLTEEQIARLEGRLGGGRERFILSTRTNRDRRWAEFQREAEEEYAQLSQDPNLMYGMEMALK